MLSYGSLAAALAALAAAILWPDGAARREAPARVKGEEAAIESRPAVAAPLPAPANGVRGEETPAVVQRPARRAALKGLVDKDAPRRSAALAAIRAEADALKREALIAGLDSFVPYGGGSPAADIVAALHAPGLGAVERSRLLEALGGLRNPGNLSALREALLRGDDDAVALCAARALAAMGTEEATDALFASLEEPGRSALRQALVQTAGAVCSQGSLGLLQRLVQDGRTSDVRLAAAVALGNYPSSESVRVLQTAMASEGAPDVRASIQSSLDRLQHP